MDNSTSCRTGDGDPGCLFVVAATILSAFSPSSVSLSLFVVFVSFYLYFNKNKNNITCKYDEKEKQENNPFVCSKKERSGGHENQERITQHGEASPQKGPNRPANEQSS